MKVNKDRPSVSVIIPAFNREDTIQRSVMSVLNQGYNDLECIVIDDCSTDRTVERVEEIKDARLRLLKNDENRGACFSRNRGIEISQGDYIAFHDSDDAWRPNKLEKQLSLMNEVGCDAVLCRYMLQDGDKGRLVPELENNCEINMKMALEKRIFSTPCLIVKKDVLKALRFDEKMPRFQDYDLGIEIYRKFSVYYLSEVLVDVYIQTNSISRNWEKYCTAQEMLLEKHRDLFSQYKEAKAINLNRLIKAKSVDGQDCRKDALELYRTDKSIKTLMKYLGSITGIIQPYYRKKMIQ